MTAREVVALVAGGLDYGEADRVVYLLTPQGAVSAFAHGAKKSKRRFSGALDPFTTVDAELSESRRAKGGLPTLTSASARRVRLGIRSELERIALGAYLLELGFRTAPEGHECEAQFELTEDALDQLEAGPATWPLRRAFELRLLDELGYAPELFRCVQCGEEPGRTYLDLVRGGLLCASHRGAAPEVGPKTLTWARAVIAAGKLDPEAGLPPEWAETAARKLSRPFCGVFDELVDRPLKSLALLESTFA